MLVPDLGRGGERSVARALAGDRRFESISLQQRVSREPERERQLALFSGTAKRVYHLA